MQGSVFTSIDLLHASFLSVVVYCTHKNEKGFTSFIEKNMVV